MANTTGNLLLDHLPPSARSLCLEHGERIDVEAGDEILRQGELATHAFFPASAICSLTVGLKSGNKAEAAVVGREGLIGISLIGGPGVSAYAAMVNVKGQGYRIPLSVLAGLLNRDAALRKAIFVYIGFRLNVLGRSVACNAYHSIVERLARWLLLTQDRIQRDEMVLTHEMLSQMLAATRPRVSLAAAKLRKLEIIDYRRGLFRILDRKRLERIACECYEATKAHQKMLPWLETPG
jgi:CRP-like cAMP-binding protein